jgi:hypothetical protein
MRVTLLFAVAASLAATPLAAQPHGLRNWDDIVQTSVWDSLQEDIVPIANKDQYSQLRICAFRKHVRLFGGTINFADGSQQALPQDLVIPASGCLRKMMLSGGQRPIESVHMLYWSEIFGPMKADVKVYVR